MSFRIEPLFPNYEDGNWDFISGNPFSTIEIEKLIAKIICVKHCFSSPGLALLLDRGKKKTEPSRDWILSFIDGCVSTLNVCKNCTSLALGLLLPLSLPRGLPLQPVKMKRKEKIAAE